MASIPYYDQHASRLVDQYETLTFQDVHADLMDMLPPPGSTVLDVGAGSGRDAAWLAANGYDVIAVEPSEAMLAHARLRHPSTKIHWISDSLPDLAKVRRLGLSFDLILLSNIKGGGEKNDEQDYRHGQRVIFSKGKIIKVTKQKGHLIERDLEALAGKP
jgi:SAM-dependent methyltransferase